MILHLRDVSYRKDGKYILDSLNWTISAGEHWIILGLNGAGKTTLLNLINGYIFPTKGSVSVLGETFGQTLIGEMRKNIGWVSNLLSDQMYPNDNCLDIILSGKFSSIGLWTKAETEDQREALKLLELFNMEEFRERSFSSLSQGEKQRIMICRSLMNSPKLLVLDEPCNGLDLIAKVELFNFINILIEKTTTTLIYVTHNIDEIQPCFTHSLLLEKGKIHSLGQTNKIITESNLTDFYKMNIELVQLKNGRFTLQTME